MKTNFYASSWTCEKSGLTIDVTNVNPDGSMVFAVHGPSGGFIDMNGDLSYFAGGRLNQKWKDSHFFNDFLAAQRACEKFLTRNPDYLDGGAV